MAAGGGKPLCWLDMVGVILAGSGGRTASFITDFGEYLGNGGDLKSCVERAPKSDFPGCDNVSNMVERTTSPGPGLGSMNQIDPEH